MNKLLENIVSFLVTVFLVYSAYRNSVNIAFLCLYLYVPTNRRQTSEFNTSIHCLIGDIFSLQKVLPYGL